MVKSIFTKSLTGLVLTLGAASAFASQVYNVEDDRRDDRKRYTTVQVATSSALENVMLPMVYAGVPYNERRDRAMNALKQIGLGNRVHNRPNQLSGGQQQRVAIARATSGFPPMR